MRQDTQLGSRVATGVQSCIRRFEASAQDASSDPRFHSLSLGIINGNAIEITDSAINVLEMPLFRKIDGSAPEMVIACLKDCSIMPPSTSDNTMGATGISAF